VIGPGGEVEKTSQEELIVYSGRVPLQRKSPYSEPNLGEDT